MELISTPATPTCSVCGEEFTEAGYLPAVEQEGGYEPRGKDAVCDACGFNEVGMMGCAPELDDVDTTGARRRAAVRPADGRRSGGGERQGVTSRRGVAGGRFERPVSGL